PSVEPPTAGETAEGAYERIAFTFEQAGFDIGRSSERPLRERGGDVRAFRAMVRVEGGRGKIHDFYVCSDPGTLRAIPAPEEEWRRLSVSMGHDGSACVRHVLSKEPHPDPEIARTFAPWDFSPGRNRRGGYPP